GTVLTVVAAGSIAGLYGTLALAGDGSYTYTIDSAAVQFLNPGERLSESFDYTIVDDATEHPLTASATLTIEIAGANDAPEAVDDSATVMEDGPTAAIGNVLVNDSDPDTGAVLSVIVPGTYIGAYGT